MMKKSFFAMLGTLLFLFTACENDSILEQDVNVDQKQRPDDVAVANKSGENNGVSYALSGLSVNPNVVSLNAGNAEIESSRQELSDGSIRVSGISDELAASFTADNILYVKSGSYAGLKKIVSVSKTGEGSYSINAVRAQLGEVFESGTIDVSLDLYKAGLAKRSEVALRAGGYNSSREILNLQDDYDFGNGLTYNPSTNIKLLYSLQLKFSKTQVLPTEFSNTFEVQLAINPQANFVGSYNDIKEYELSEYIPQALLDFIKEQEFEFKIPINTLGIDSLPAILKVKDIKIPVTIEANISNESTFAYSLNGSYKIGYKISITGLKSKVTPIYENTIVAENPSTSETFGELLTDSKIIITPDISILDGAYTVDGDLTLGNKTTTYGNVAIPGQDPVFGSKGVNTTKLTASVDLILLKVPVEVINTDTVIWNVGTIVKSVVYSDLKYTLGSYKDNTNVLSWGLVNRAYDTEFTLNYKYPIIGKKIPSELLISYDVYEDNNSTKIVSVKDQVINPSDITANSFKFHQDIPFRGKTTIKIFPPSITTTYQTKVYIKNIVIKDKNDYIYEGIYNTTKGIVENSLEIKK